MRISGKTKLCIIIGDPVQHSLSPAMHNAAYQHLGIDKEFVFIAAHVKKADLETAVKAVKAMNIRGLTCTIPHKVEIIKYLDIVDKTAKEIGAVNTVLNKNGKLIGYNTDWFGIVKPLNKIINIKGKNVAIIGAGGAARAAAYGILKSNGNITIFNRDSKKAELLSQDLKTIFKKNVAKPKSLGNIHEVKDFDIIINTTPIGMPPNINKCLIPIKYISQNQIIFDIVYMPNKTKLIKDAEKKGAKIIHGLEMLLYQGVMQFEIYTNKKAPENIMRKILEKNL